MRWLSTLNENIKRGVRSWLNVVPASGNGIQINEVLDFEANAIRNRIWYRGDSNELEQMYQQLAEYADKYKFWASKCTPGMEMRKIHTGLPGLIVRILSAIVLADMNDFDFDSPAQEQLWKEIEKENKFRKALEKSLKEVLYIGDGAYKVTIDTAISQYPILEWYPGERIEIIKERGRLKEVVFKTPYNIRSQQYILYEHYGYGYIRNELYKGDAQVDMGAIEATKGIKDTKFDDTVILAVPLQIYESTKYESRGGSIFDGKLDSFDAFDEAWSQWMDALRAGRAKTYIPDCLVPHDPETGKVIRPNPFDDRYFASDNDMSENADNKVNVVQPTIPHDSYLASFVQLWTCACRALSAHPLWGLMSRSWTTPKRSAKRKKLPCTPGMLLWRLCRRLFRSWSARQSTLAISFMVRGWRRSKWISPSVSMQTHPLRARWRPWLRPGQVSL